jgi:hypothetical protein
MTLEELEAMTADQPMTAEQAAIILLQCMSPLLAQSGRDDGTRRCLLLGAKQTWRGRVAMSGFEPKRKSMPPFCCDASATQILDE